jgi:hypothetical protein
LKARENRESFGVVNNCSETDNSRNHASDYPGAKIKHSLQIQDKSTAFM